MAAGGIDLVNGTHAVVQEWVRFRHLGIAVIDEQHKFGVRQRTSLQAKGSRPHLLVMTATPIPRTLALTLYGDLDVSVIDEMPPGRRPVKTLVRPRSRMRESLEFVREQLRAGDQAYFVYPLIDDSDDLPLKSATRMAKELQAGPFREFRVGLLHGGMKGEEKESVLESFRRGATRVLVSTLVIEVGIDVPRATILVVEHAERYGLSQLHQLRGRVGRPLPPGAKTGPCYCILFGNPSTPEAQKRLRALAETGDGFKIAEEDLRIRGPGEMIGLRQSGIPEFRVADPVRDAAVLMQAREDAGRLLASDPGLKGGECVELRMFLKRRYGGAEVLLGSG